MKGEYMRADQLRGAVSLLNRQEQISRVLANCDGTILTTLTMNAWAADVGITADQQRKIEHFFRGLLRAEAEDITSRLQAMGVEV